MEDTASFEKIVGNLRREATFAARKKTKRQVSFAHTTRVMFVPGLYEMTDAEMSATWYSDDDSDALQGDIVHSIKAMRKGIKSNDVCFRGLEHMRSPQHLNERKFLKKSIVDAVLAEQDKQRCSGIFDPEEISRLSVSCSRVATELALTLAAADESFVRRTVKREGRQRVAPKKPMTSLEKESEICFSVLENALALSSVRKHGESSTLSLTQKAGSTNCTVASSSRISRVFGGLLQEQQPKLMGKQPPASSSTNLNRNKVSSGLKDEGFIKHGSIGGSGAKMNSGVMGLRAMMMRRNDTNVVTS